MVLSTMTMPMTTKTKAIVAFYDFNAIRKWFFVNWLHSNPLIFQAISYINTLIQSCYLASSLSLSIFSCYLTLSCVMYIHSIDTIKFNLKWCTYTYILNKNSRKFIFKSIEMGVGLSDLLNASKIHIHILLALFNN